MKRSIPTLGTVCLVALAFPEQLPAQTSEALPPELLACSEEIDVERRLACFDRELANLKGEPVAEPAPEPPSVIETPGAMEESAAIEGAAPVADASAPQNPVPGEDFGVSNDGASELVATVTDIARRPYGELVILLDNGQVWEQKHRDTRFRIAVGEEVTISKGVLSGYRLAVGQRNNTIQVERIK